MNGLLKLFAALVATSAIVAVVNATSAYEIGGDPFNPFALARQASQDCTTVKIPPKMCIECRMLPFTGNGNFARGTYDMYDIDLPKCKQQIQKYLQLNQCDKDTREAVKDNDRGDIAYFMYSVCEQCCDCIPIGARPEQYDNRKKNKRLLSVRRGNCAAHFHYDVCRIWNEVEHITHPDGADVSRPEVCGQFRNWIFSSDASDWLRNPRANGLTKDMRRAMWSILFKTRCTNKRVWQDCARLEAAQSRI